MARQRAWKDKRAWVESDAKKRTIEIVKEYKIPFYIKFLAIFSKKVKLWHKGKWQSEYDRVFHYLIKRMSHNVHLKTNQEIIEERRMQKTMQKKRRKEIEQGKRRPIKMKVRTK
jgi:DNA-binding FadR family transcriptional regulator